MKYSHPPKKGYTETLGGTRYVCHFDIVMVSQGLAYVRTHQIVCIKYVQFFVYDLHFSKAVI